MQKRSFFQKLTGSYPYEEESSEEAVNIKPNHQGGRTIEKATSSEIPEEEDGQLTVDVYQTPDAIVIQSIIAGIRPDDIDISITREMVTIRGHRQDSRSIEEHDFFYRELYWGSFSRTIVLPQEIEPEEATASEKFGLLTITLPKINKEKVAKLRVRSNS